LADPGTLLHIDDRDGVVVLVGHVQDLAGRILRKELGIGTRWQRADNLMVAGVDDLDSIVVTDCDQNKPSILAHFNAAGSLADLDGLYHRELVGVDYGYGVAFLVRDVGGKGARRGMNETQQTNSHKARAPSHRPSNPSINSSGICFRVGRRRAYPAPKLHVGSLPAEILKLSSCRRSEGWAGEAGDSNPGASAAGL